MKWLKIIRPQTLFASACPVVVGLCVSGVGNWLVAIVTLLCALDLQIFSNLVNDYYDYVRGADKAGRVGFSRALAEGLVSKERMLRACLIALALSVLMGAYLLWVGGWPILIIGVTAILFAWLYTATNHSLSYLGIADIFVFLYYGVIATAGTAYLQTGSYLWQAFYAGAVCGLISMCVLITNNLRDIEDDREVGKKTFPVRFGKRAGEVGYCCVVALMPLFAYLAFGKLLPMFIVFPAIFLTVKVLKAEGKQYNKCLLGAGLLNLCFTILVLISINL